MRSFEEGRVSVLTPCYNGEAYLDRYFTSLSRQTYDDLEIIVVNDGSTDDTEAVCLSWKDELEARGYAFRYIPLAANRGAAGAINAGLPYVTGEYLIWPDCDDALMPTSVAKRVEFLESHPDYAMVRSDYAAVREENPGVVVRYGSEGAVVHNEDIFEDLLFERTYCTSGCYMVRSAVLFERIPACGIYWQNRAGQNWQLLIPCAYRNKTGYIDEPLYIYYIRPESHSHRIEGEEYSGLRERTFLHQELQREVISAFYLLAEDEKAWYLARIDRRYSMKRLKFALRYNRFEDATAELRALRRLGADPGAVWRVLYRLCRFGASGAALRGHSLLYSLADRLRQRSRGGILCPDDR